MTDEIIEKLKQYSFKLLSIRPRSIYEFKQKLSYYCRRNVYSEKYINQIVEMMINIDFLDDMKFALWWLNQRDNARPKGKYALTYELKNKGISTDIIGKVLSSKNRDQTYQFDLAIKVIEKKSEIINNLTKTKKFIKIRDYLMRRGFDMDIISKVIDYYTKKD